MSVGRGEEAETKTEDDMRPLAGGRGLTAFLLAAFFLSGAVGVAAEVVWGKLLQLSIGATGTAHAVVLATFMGGLALGNALFGRLGDRGDNQLRLYGLLELATGLSLVLFPTVFDALLGVYLSLAAPDPTSLGNLVLRIGFSAALLAIPSTLMGGTLPVLTRFFVRRRTAVGEGVGLLYFINSSGAVAGCALAGFYLIPKVGAELAIILPGTVGVLLGLLCLYWSRRVSIQGGERTAAAASPDSNQELYRPGQARLVLVAMFVTGFLTMVYELAWTRLLGLVLGSSVYSFSIMLMTFIAGIAAGSLVVARLMRGPRDALKWLGIVELGVAVSVALLMPVYEVLPYVFNVMGQVLVRTPGTFPVYLLQKVLLSMGAMALPTVFIGMSLPLASHVCVRSVSRVGTQVGSVFSVNTAGNLVGAALAGHVVIAWAGLQGSMLLGMAGSALVGALLLAARLRGAGRVWPPLVALAVAGVVAWTVPAWHPAALNSGRYRARGAVAESLTGFLADLQSVEVLYQRDGADMSVAVLKSKETGHLSMMVNGKPDAATGGDMSTQVLLGQLPVTLHPDPKRALVIGLGSGVTAGSVLAAPVEQVDVVEISDDVVEASRLFDDYSGAPLDDPRTRLWIADARDFLLLNADAQYDIIISEPSNPWMAGIGNLMTAEFFEVALGTLRDDGLMVQWLHLYEMSPEVFSVILNTFSSVFPYVTVWCPRNADVLLLGARKPLTVDLGELDARIARPEVQRLLAGWENGGSIRNGLEFLAQQVLSNETFKAVYPGTGRRNLDAFPYVEYAAPRAFYTGEDVRIFLELDERLLSRQRSGLLLAGVLGERELSSESLRQLIRFFDEGSTSFDDDRMERLLWQLLMRHVDVTSGDLALVGATPDEVRTFLEPFLRRGEHGRLGELLLWRKTISAGRMAGPDWDRYRRFEASVLKETSSVFAVARPGRYLEAWELCRAMECATLEVLCREWQALAERGWLAPNPECTP